MVGEVTERIAVARPSLMSDDLMARIASGVVLGGVALAANWAGAVPFSLLVAGIALVMSWEWARIVRDGAIDGPLIVHLVAVEAAVLAVALGYLGWALAVLGIATAVTTLLAMRDRPLISGVGVLYVGLPAIALIWLRQNDPQGALAILFIYTIVWTTDTFAFTCGKLLGGPRLWPMISPGKTWAGTLGGVAFAALAAFVFATLVSHPQPLALVLVGIIMSIAAQGGDLAESALKRTFAMKHASHLIPGHGGFMDRMDGIVAVASLAALLAAVCDPQAPARALLYWF